ncbi:MAG: protein-L-isoaspartate(D-aspartate) O-methyltransferase [Planctomycetota bacterium]|nr:protein-L-isoaspartate(D-aspartate) O-methyltransferase [Planctomycetota bacterium]MCX8039310.1 protein-L-isoaspartate(D-aspartate) O-methyltransferase [Planctomycetota bacterium]MDW8372075.1 protein-L-isoaspartate(D-aspartate) O-methyltransferase [Planctomycetota bacterium]
MTADDDPIYARLRQRMVREQLSECRDPRVLAAMAAVPRERFVPDDARALAYSDGALPIGCGQTISQPRVVACMLAALRLAPGMRVLDVGCGSGYTAALLAELVSPGGAVYALERIADLAERARQRLQGLPVVVIHADAHGGWPAAAPYDAIHVAAAAATVPPALLAQLAPQGRLVMPLGPPEEQELWLYEGGRRSCLGGVRFVPFVPGTVPPSA